MINKFFNKTISILITMIFLFGLFPPNVFAGPASPSLPNEVKGFNKTIFDYSFSRADREINPEQWLSQAKLGLTQAIYSWELIAVGLYEDPSLYQEAKNNLEKWSSEELEARFSDWLIGRFFGEAAEKSIISFSQNLSDTQRKYSWHLDGEGNVIFDDKTGDPLVIRPNDDGREFSDDIVKWQNDTQKIISNASLSHENIITQLFPELLAYIPPELRESMTALINETVSAKNNVIKHEFENIAAREERIFTSRRTRDIWSLRNKSENEAAKLFTERLISETDAICKSGIEELNIRIEQAEAGVGDLALLGEEWLRLYKEQFDKGLKAWEDAEERFFVRRIEWEQDSFKLYSEGEEVWLSAFTQFEEERKKWELNAKDLFEAGEKLFITLSEDFQKNIAEAKKEFEFNMVIRLEEETTKVKALIDMYLTCASASISAKDTVILWQKQYGKTDKDPSATDFLDWVYKEMITLFEEAKTNYLSNESELTKMEEMRRILDDPYSGNTMRVKNEFGFGYTTITITEDDYRDLYIQLSKTHAYYFEIKEILKGRKSLNEIIAIAKTNNFTHLNRNKFTALSEMLSPYSMYQSYLEKAVVFRDKIYDNYAELFGTGSLKDILSNDASSEDFYLDEYQIALVRAKALVLHWERKTEIAQAVVTYADELSAKRITEAEGIRAWENAKSAYNESLAVYETELKKLNNIGIDIKTQQELLDLIFIELCEEEEKLNKLFDEYTLLNNLTVINNENYFRIDLNEKYKSLVNDYKFFLETGEKSIYKDTLINGLLWGLSEQQNNQEKDWQTSLDPLVSLFDSYGYTLENNFLPDVHDICEIIFNESGSFMQNSVDFLLKFDNCFTVIPQWLEQEIYSWRNAFIEYITTYAFFMGIEPDVKSEQLLSEHNELMQEYMNLFEYFLSLEEISVEEEKLIISFNSIFEKLSPLNYQIEIINIWDNLVLTSSENKKHWRQSIKNENFDKINYLAANVKSWEEGKLADSFYTASYYTNRLNDALILFSKSDLYITNENIDYKMLYFYSAFEIDMLFNMLSDRYIDILNAQDTYELAKLSSQNISKQIQAKKETLDAQEKIYNKKRNEYFAEAEHFLEIGKQYDEQYSTLKKAYENADLKRFEYEKQDAIQRWASTAYINTDIMDLDNCKAKLQKAQTVLNVLSDLYGNEEKRMYNDPAYDTLYAAYEQSFSRKIKALEVANTLYSNIIEEEAKKASIYADYQNSLHNLGSVNQNYENYTSPKSRSSWSIKDIITVRNGRLAFTTNGSLYITGVDEANANLLTEYFFKEKDLSGNERFKESEYEKALLSLNQRMSSYIYDYEKACQWSLARDYLISSLIKSNRDLKFLSNYFNDHGQLENEGSLGLLLIATERNKKKDTLYSNISGNYIYYASSSIFLDAWNGLSADEKADLEFYVILTLNNSNGYSAGFSEVYNMQLYQHAYNYVDKFYQEAKEEADKWYRVFTHRGWVEMEDTNRIARDRISHLLNQTSSNVYKWYNGLKSNQNTINDLNASYIASCNKLEQMEGKKADGKNIEWKDINLALSTAKIKAADISAIKSYWELMNKEISGNEYKTVSSALAAIIDWTKNKENENVTALENHWKNASNTQQFNDFIFQLSAEAYVSGNINIEELKSAAENAYGENAAALKNHLSNKHTVMLNDLSILMDSKFNFNSEFSALGQKILLLSEETLRNRYFAEYTAREAEYQQMMNDIVEKYYEWQKSASIILENGRTDWIKSQQKMEDAYKQWQTNFKNEYERVSGEWALVYLAGLEDKEKWLEQAANAANHASSESFLSLVGTEGERLSRFMDTREPYGIIDAVPQAQNLMTELLQSSGIANMTNAFNTLASFTGVTSPLVRRGMGGISNWDASLAKTAASDLAKQTNADIANNEARMLAYNARLSAEEAIKNLSLNVNMANEGFRENMDNIFISNGLWKKEGNYYTKEIIKGSTYFTPVISEQAYVTVYRDYKMKEVELKTNLNQDYLANLNSLAIRGLIQNAFNEVQEISNEIFGTEKEEPTKIYSRGESREQSPGMFGAHIGYAPDNKPDMGQKRSEMFYDEGSGELGRLMADFTYWKVIDNVGIGELSMAPWDKRLWNDDGSWFDAPSLKTVGSIACTVNAAVLAAVGVVATPFTGGSSLAVSVASIALIAAINTTDDLVFNTLDAAYGYKTWGEAIFDVNKTYTINFASSFISGAFGSVSDGVIATAKATGSIAKTIATQTIMSGMETVTTGVTTSFLSGFTYSSKGGGLSFSDDIVTESLKSTFQGGLVSMASTLTTSSLTAINSGINMEKLVGFNNINKNDLDKLNGLAGSLAGQGVNYALGNDFTLNLLNMTQFTGGYINTGLLELHLGQEGTSMNFGTGGANVALDNLAASFRGLQVWDTNNRISSYGNKNNFDALVTLRAQYGYGDAVQKDQLFDILKGDATLITDANGDYTAKTSIDENGNRVINLSGYQQGMSNEDQFLLAVVLGHEAYRDGHVTDNNNIETRDATLAHTQMAIRIKAGGEKMTTNANLENDIKNYNAAYDAKDMSLFNAYVDNNYDSSEDYWKLVIDDDNIARFVWDRQYTFDLTALGIEGSVDTLDDDTLDKIRELGYLNMEDSVFKASIDSFYNLNTIAKSLEDVLKASALETSKNNDNLNTTSNSAVNNQIEALFNAFKAVESSGMLSKTDPILATPSGNGPNIFASGTPTITNEYGIRPNQEKDKYSFEEHYALDLVNDDKRLVAPMSGSLSLYYNISSGFSLITSGLNNQSITYAHSSADSIKNIIDVFSSNSVTVNGNSLSGIAQNMIIGTMGNTGIYTTGAHVHLEYKVNGVKQDPRMYFNNTTFPVTDYAKAMTGFNSKTLTNTEINGMLNYLNKNYTNPTTTFFKYATASNNYADFSLAFLRSKGINP